MAKVATLMSSLSLHRPPTKHNIYDLHQAIKAQQVDLVKGILQQISLEKFNLNTTVCGATALSLSLYRNITAVFDLLMVHSNELDLDKISRDDHNRLEPPLITACRLDDIVSAECLLRHGAQVDTVDAFQHTALWTAARQRNSLLVKLLIHYGASAHPSEKLSCSPLYLCMKYAHKRRDIAQDLIIHGAFVNMQCDISFLCQSLCSLHFTVVEMMIEAGYNVSADKEFIEALKANKFVINEEMLSILNEETQTPASLMRQSRTVIRSHISRKYGSQHFIYNLLRLPLPSYFLNYLSMYANKIDQSSLAIANKN